MFLRQLFQCKFLTVILLLGSSFYTATGRAEVWLDIKNNVITGNGVFDCTECHSYQKTNETNSVAPTPTPSDYRHGAPISVNFDGINDLTAYNNTATVSTNFGVQVDDGTATFQAGTDYNFADNSVNYIYEWMAILVDKDYMPMDPTADANADGVTENLVAATALIAAKKTLLKNWALQGAPFAAPSATTDNNPTSITKLSAVVRGDFDTNVHSGTAVPGTYYFEYGTTTGYGSSTSVSNRSSTSTLFNTTKSISVLKCGTLYHYRARATNGSATGASAAAGVDRTFTTDPCTAPVVAGVSIAADATVQNANEDSNNDFGLTVSDDDPGSLRWSKTNGAKGTVTLISPTNTAFNGSAAVRYAPTSNLTGADVFTVTVNNMNSGTSRTITFNMTIIDDAADPPNISGTTTVNDNEDGVNAANGTPTPIVVSLSASDPDVSPTYHWDVTASNEGTPGFSVNTGATPTINYLPLANDNGSPADNFTVRVCDGGSFGAGNCDSQVVTVNLMPQQDNPTAVGEVSGINVLEGASNVILTVIGNDIDPDAGEALTLVPVNVSVTTGDLTFNGVVNGNQISVTHGGAEEITASLTYQVRDTTNLTSANTVTANITVVGTDDPPTSTDLTVSGTVDEGTTSTIDLVSISNDPESSTMAVCDTMTTPTSGNASVSIISSGPDIGKVLYSHIGTNVPAGGSTDTFTYQVNDANNAACSSGNNSGFSMVTVNLAPVNDVPVAVVDSITVAEGGTVTVLVGGNTSVLTNDTDEENGTGTGFTVSSNSTPAFSQAFSLNNADGTFSYQHDSSENFSTSFTYIVNDGAANSVAAGTVNITVMPVNDKPLINSAAPTTAIVLTEQNAANVYQVTQTDPDDGSFTYSLDATGLAGDTPAGNMAIGASGMITWAPPRSSVFNKATAMVTVTVSDVDASTAGANILSDTQNFMVATSPFDSDSDGVADYSDNCPSISNAGQQDMDNDTVHTLPQTDPSGIPADGDVDPAARNSSNALAESYLKGGDACDEDADGDGLSNTFEDSYAFLDPLDPADASADEDGDGVSNLDEFLASTAPDVDSVGPTVNAPADITVNATGLLTVVDLGTATGSDGNDGNSTLFKAAVNLTQLQKDDLAVAITGCQTFSDYETEIEPFRPGQYVVTWATCDSSGNSGQDDQVVNVKPLVSVNSGQSVGDGQAVSVKVLLNGDVISYPATVEYTISGTAVAVDDHDAVAGTVNFTSPDNVGVINFNTVANSAKPSDALKSDATVVITLHTPTNTALSNANVHTVTITQFNVAPQVTLKVTQPAAALDKNKGNTLYTADGAAKIVASASDGNGDTLSFDWSATDNTLLALATITGNQIDIDPTLLTTGSFYKVVVSVSDGVTPVTIERLLLVKAGEVNVWLVGADADGDGKLNVLEGYGDDDADGIPNYIDSHSIPPNAIENQTVNLETSVYIETDPGLKIAMGETAIAAQASGVLIGMQDIIDHGGAGGTAVVNAATDHVFFSGLLNFEISGLTSDILSANVVIPLPSAIQADAVYRKYNNSGWFDFVEDDLNALSSATGSGGTCPQPGSNLYTAGLTPGHLCLQLTIQDGGANDADGVRNFVIKDPGGLALEPESDVVAAPSNASGRVGSVGLWFMLILSITARQLLRLRVRAAVNTAG